MSQPHLHNVLKGVRSLSPAYTDLILLHLDLSVLDLITRADWEQRSPPAAGTTANIPLLSGTAGPKQTFDSQSAPIAVFPISNQITDPLIHPFLISLGYDPLLVPYFQSGDIALVTRPAITAAAIGRGDFYLVKTADGTLVRSVRLGGKRLYLIAPATRDEPRKWEELPLGRQPLSEVILGKLAYVARKLSDDSFLLATPNPFMDQG